MITNERQYKITKSQLTKLQNAIKLYNLDSTLKETGSDILAKAEYDALQSEVEVLLKQIQDYDHLKSGVTKILKANSLRELPNILIQARIAQGLSQLQLANRLNLKEQQVQRYEADEYSNASLKRIVEVSDALNLNISEIAELQHRLIKHAQEKYENVINWNNFPIEQMYKRGWFEGFNGSLNAAIEEGEYLVQNFVKDVFRKPFTSFHKKRIRSKNNLNHYSLIAWECRVIHIAKKTHEQKIFKKEFLTTNWLTELARQSQFEDGPIRAQIILKEIGIEMVIEPHLPNTYLDGAVLLHNDNPIIGLTLRFDRLDNFWFVLFHELAHLVKHIKKGNIESIFDDLEAEPDKLESEADELALNTLIPESIWETALPRFLRNETSIISFAQGIKINPAIVAGRIRYEAQNYVILNSLVGQGTVRKCFPEIEFGI